MLTACTSFGDRPYAGDLQTLQVRAIYPEGYEEFVRSGVTATAQEVSSGILYRVQTDAEGRAEFRLANGIYRVSIQDRATATAMFNGVVDRVQIIDGDRELPLPLTFAKNSAIVFKEIYCGGCSKAPEQGTFNYDQYIILHNNSAQTVYLDGLCFGAADPYNSSSGTNVWVEKDPVTGETIFPGYVPVIQAIWQFGGNGTDFPLEPGADAVISITGAVNHAAQYPQSVNLNKADYFVLYDQTLFPNPSYHPAPGDQIQQSHILRVAIKLGRANAYTFSFSSPASVIFRPVDTTLEAFLSDSKNVVQKPGSASDMCVLIPEGWIIDGAEIFTTPSDPVKRLSPEVDAGFAVLSEMKKGHTIHRLRDEEASAEAGYEIYIDTNNSSNDFYERETQSLHE